jgi:hypothetical protein
MSEIVEKVGALPDIGVEMEIVLEKDGHVVYEKHLVEEVATRLGELGFCVSVEGRAGSLPPRIEVKLCRPLKNLEDIRKYFESAIEKIRELGYEPRVEKWGTYSGSVHITISDPMGLVASSGFARELYYLLDNFDSRYTCYRIATYSTLSPSTEFFYANANLLESAIEHRQELLKTRDARLKLSLLVDRRKMRELADEFSRAVKSGDLYMCITSTEPSTGAI